jgi:hypothetical protein
MRKGSPTDVKAASIFSNPFFIMTKSINILLLKGSSDPKPLVIRVSINVTAPNFHTGRTNRIKNKRSRYLKGFSAAWGFFKISER